MITSLLKYVLMVVSLLPFPVESVVHTGTDTLFRDSNTRFIFSIGSDVPGASNRDFSFQQYQNWPNSSLGSFHNSQEIWHVGEIEFEELLSVPSQLTIDPRFEDPTNISIYERHSYIIKTVEGYWGKIYIEDVVTAGQLEIYGPDHPGSLEENKIHLSDGEWRDADGIVTPYYPFIHYVIFRWAYQDDGTDFFDTDTIVGTATWAKLKKNAIIDSSSNTSVPGFGAFAPSPSR